MSMLNNKIDFAVLVSVTMANPNGDPLDGNRPRTSYNGFGEISDVCVKRKIRNRMQDMGQRIFVQSDDRWRRRLQEPQRARRTHRRESQGSGRIRPHRL